MTTSNNRCSTSRTTISSAFRFSAPVAAATFFALFASGCFGPDDLANRRPVNELSKDPAGQTMIVNLRLANGTGAVRLTLAATRQTPAPPCRVLIIDRAGETFGAQHSSGCFWLTGERTVRLPAGAYSVRASRSLFEPEARFDVVIKRDETASVEIRIEPEPYISPASRGVQIAGLWRQSAEPTRFIPPLTNPDPTKPLAVAPGLRFDSTPDSIRAIMRAEGADIIALSTTSSDRLVGRSDPRVIRAEPLDDPIWGRALFISSHRVDTAQTAAQPDSQNPFEPFVSPFDYGLAALTRSNNPVASVLYDIDGDSIDGDTFFAAKRLPVLLACGRTFDALGLSATSMPAEHISSLPERPGVEPIASQSALNRCGTDAERAQWFSILNTGYCLPAIGVERQPLHRERLLTAWTLLYGSGGMSAPAAIRDGLCGVTTGPAVFIEGVERDAAPGAIIPADGRPLTIKIDALAARRVDRHIRYIELIRNGTVVARHVNDQPLDYLAGWTMTLRETRDAWYVAHVVEGGADAGECFTSPIYFREQTGQPEPRVIETLVHGQAVDADGEPVSNARIVVIRAGTLWSETTTDNAGEFAIAAPLDSRIGCIADGYAVFETSVWEYSGVSAFALSGALPPYNNDVAKRLAEPVSLTIRLTAR